MSKIEYAKYATVILEAAIGKSLDYGVPDHLLECARRGMRVSLTLRGRLCYGYIFNIKEKPDFSPVQPLREVLHTHELITDEIFNMALWMARYYCTTLSKVLKIILPASVRKSVAHKQQLFVMRGKTRDELVEHCIAIRNKHPAQAEVLDAMLQVTKGVLLTELLEETGGSRSPVETLAKKGYLILDIVRVDRSPLINEEYFKTKPKNLNPEQAQALEKIETSLSENKFETHLLYGITGSGKTEVYLRAIEHTLKMGKGTIMLVPEIALTAQTIERFRSRFEGNIAILHHRLSDGERFDEWHRIREGRAKIVIGARSAIFSPVPDLGLIIVDEEHEPSYKQTDEAPCYHARDMAVLRGKISNSTVILGSATPSVESYHNALQGKYTLSRLNHRAEAATKAKVTIVDMKHEYAKAKGMTSFSDALLSGIKKRQQLGEQTILFLNRRGYHTTLMCRSCGESIKCRHCDVALTFHKNHAHLACHLCGFTITPPPTLCPKCKCPNPMSYKGVGTEQIEKALYAIFPDIKVIRLDADTTKHKGSHQKLLRQFGSGKADILVGTQMIAKGLHFPQVTLVGVLNSDSALNIPDFRSSEVVFQLITQVAGRSGRGSMQGEVIIQTCMPDNSTIQLAANQDYEAFYKDEIATREMFKYPPFNNIVKANFYGEDQKKTLNQATLWQKIVRSSLSAEYQVYPVTPCGHAKIKDQHRFHFVIIGPSIYTVNEVIEKLRIQKPPSSGIRSHIDVNPQSIYF